MPPTTANEVADFLLHFAHEHGDMLTNLKLQKLVYYAHAWHLALKDAPLFDDQFQALVHGPVIPHLYGRFKKHRWDPIPANPDRPLLSVEVEEHLIEVFNAYGKYSAWDLERMTHQEEPWKKARGGMEPDEECKTVISNEEMGKFYKSLSKSI